MTIFLIVVASVFSYSTMGGAVGARVQTVGSRKCRYSEHDSECAHWWLAGVSMLFWPVLLPIMLGYILGQNDKTVRDRKRAARELEQAKRSRELEQENLREAQAITQRLRLLGHKDV